MLITANRGNPRVRESVVFHQKDIPKSAQSGVPDRCADRSWPKTKIKKSHKPTVATPSDSESIEDDNISRLDDVEAYSLDLSGLDDDHYLRVMRQKTGVHILLNSLCERKRIVCIIC